MVRGIYQTSEATKERSSIVSAAIAFLVVSLLVGGGFKFIWDWGDSLCGMRYYDRDIKTYKEHAEKVLHEAGFSYSRLKDRGDHPPHQKYSPNPKIRKFFARDLKVPDGGTLEKAYVYVEFDSWNQNYAITTVKRYVEIE